MADEGWDPRRETLCEYVQRTRHEEQMTDYDDHSERRLERSKAQGYRWLSARDSTVARRRERSEARRLRRSKTKTRLSARLPKRATRRERDDEDLATGIPRTTDP